MLQKRLPKQTLYAKVNGKKSVERPWTEWLDPVEVLGCNRLGLCQSKMQSVSLNREVWGFNLKLLFLQL